MKRTVEVPAEMAGERLDAVLSGLLELTRSAVQKLCDDGRVTLEGSDTPLKKNHKTAPGDRYTADLPEAEPTELLPVEMPPESSVDKVMELIPDAVSKLSGFLEKRKGKDM